MSAKPLAVSDSAFLRYGAEDISDNLLSGSRLVPEFCTGNEISIRSSKPTWFALRSVMPNDSGKVIGSPRADLTEIQRGIALLFKAGDVVEIRIPKTRAGVVSGYFDDPVILATAILEADGEYRAPGIYYVLNRTNPALLGRAYNRLKQRAEYTTADNNILGRRWLPVDLDPVRPAGISSSDEEHAATIARARVIAEDMATEWGPPIIADSGNGAHLLYAIDLLNDEESLAFVSGALAELDRRYSDDEVRIDVTCANAGRIWKAYGSVARKGDSIPGRPHRLTRILEVPCD
jgi:hypothetical protein